MAAFVVRTSEQVDASSDNRELTPIALYVPILPIPILLGLWLQYRKEMKKYLAAEEGSDVENESTGLLNAQYRDKRRSSIVSIEQAFSMRASVDKRISAAMMGGVTAYDTKAEQELSERMEKDLQAWAELANLDCDDKRNSA